MSKVKIDGLPLRGFNPDRYKTPNGAAKAFYRALVKHVDEVYGDSYPDAGERECYMVKENDHSGGWYWRVGWEGGPFQWAWLTSFKVCNHEAGWYTEPYYSFDLCFHN